MGLEETVGRNERLFEVWSSLLFTLVTPTTKPKDRNVKKKKDRGQERKARRVQVGNSLDQFSKVSAPVHLLYKLTI